MADKAAALNPAMDSIIRKVVKDRGYKFEKDQTFADEGSYLIRIENISAITGRDFVPNMVSTDCIYIGIDVDDRSTDVTFSVVPDEISSRAEILGVADIMDLYISIAASVPRYSYALSVDDDGYCFVEHRFTVSGCNSAEAFESGLDTCFDAARDYINGIENDLGLKY